MPFSQSVFRGPVKQCVAAALAMLGSGSAIYAQDGQVRAVVRGNLAGMMLAEHNGERSALGLASLVWDAALAKDAGRWAAQLAAENRFEHAFGDLRRTKQGENLWMGTADAYAYPEMVSFWLDERKMAKSGVFPDISRTGKWADVGHYSQMIWPTTRKVGCAIARNKEDEFLVCRYFPAGNRIGDRLDVTRRK
jgi:Cysteine-rich secretory protein family